MPYVSQEYVRNLVGERTLHGLTDGLLETFDQLADASTAVVMAYLRKAGFPPSEIPTEADVLAGGGASVSTRDAHLLRLATAGHLLSPLFGRKSVQPRTQAREAYAIWKMLAEGSLQLVDKDPTPFYAPQGFRIRRAGGRSEATDLSDLEDSIG